MIGKFNSFVVDLLITTFTITSMRLATSYGVLLETKEVPGLYDGFKKVQHLNNSNFEEELFEKQNNKMWLVEFYKHWCGDCMRFVPMYKALAHDIHEWRDTVVIGVLDCANPINNDVCRNNQVGKVPTLTIFHPKSDKHSLGVNYGEEGNVNYIEIREKIVKILKEYQNNQSVVDGPVNLKLLTDSDLEELWSTFPKSVEYLILVFERKDSVVGSQLALDLSRIVDEVRVRLVDPNNKIIYWRFDMEQDKSGAVILPRDPSLITKHYHPVEVDKTEGFTRKGLNTAVRKLLRGFEINITLDLPHVPTSFTTVTSQEIKNATKRDNELKKLLNITDLTAVVFQMDLEAAVHYIFTQEVSQISNITGESLLVLRSFVHVLLKYFPTGTRGKLLFEKLQEVLDQQKVVQGKDLHNEFLQLESKLNPFMPNSEWVGCRGSIPMFRGYPCSLWTLFHTLVATEALDYKGLSKIPEALNAIAGYVKYFFSCKVCSENFTKRAKTIAGEVNSLRDAVLWLWKAHNSANDRLAGDATEDPRYHKVQFPPSSVCPACHSKGAGVSWDENQVFTFLTNMFTNPIQYDPHQ